MSTTLDMAAIQAAAGDLAEAERTRVQMRQLSQTYPGMTLADAYAIQQAWIERKIAGGLRPIGWKVGLTSKAMQQQLGIDEPDSGMLLEDMQFADGALVPKGRFIQPRVEAELAFVIGRRVEGPRVTLFDILAATDCVVPALEILDTRIQRVDPQTKATRRIVDTVADNAANAGIVLGGRAMKPDAVDMRWVGAILTRNAAVEETGLAAGVLGHPAAALVWLVASLHRQGQALEPGQVVLSGSFVRAIETMPDCTVMGDFGPLGTVGVHFA
jgi:2-oxo-hept-3-ene-1,7-dioate hydratase